MSNAHGSSTGNHRAELDEPAVSSHSLRRQALTRLHSTKKTMCANATLITRYRMPTGWHAEPLPVQSAGVRSLSACAEAMSARCEKPWG